MPRTRTDRTVRASGHVSACSRWVTGEATATARLDVINAVPTARGCQVPSSIRAANSAPPSGTLYTAPSPAPAAHASRISRSRAVSESLVVPKSPIAAASWRGAPSRPRDAPDPTSSTCRPASIDIASRGIGRWLAIVSANGGTVGPPPQHPPSEPGQRAADHRADGAPHGAAVTDSGQQRAE